jgi:hypothetical protein|tara:strand:+ start:1380 stop:1574 length:195 start_codon:yes stop_codon:yes gene_type:complete
MIEPTVEDINAVLQNNPQAAQQLQIVTLTRTVKEQEEEIKQLKEQLETGSKNGKGNAKELEKVT